MEEVEFAICIIERGRIDTYAKLHVPFLPAGRDVPQDIDPNGSGIIANRAGA